MNPVTGEYIERRFYMRRDIAEAARDFFRRNVGMVFEIHLAPDEEGCAHVLLIAPCAVLQDCDRMINGPAGFIALGDELLQFFFIAHILVVRLFAGTPFVWQSCEKLGVPAPRQVFEDIHAAAGGGGRAFTPGG